MKLPARRSKKGGKPVDRAGRMIESASQSIQRGDWNEGLVFYQKAYLALVDALGREHPRVTRLIEDLGDRPAARASYTRALGILEKYLPPDHPYLWSVRDSLAAVDTNLPV